MKKYDKNYEEELNQLNIKLNEEKNKNKQLNKRIKALEKIIDNKKILLNEEKNLTKKLNERINELNNLLKDNNSNMTKIIELMKKIETKENEIKEIKSRYSIELQKGEKLLSVIFKSIDQNILCSIICKNTDKFSKVEDKLYEEYPNYSENENFFIVNGKKVNRFKIIEENGIKNSDTITLKSFVDDD